MAKFYVPAMYQYIGHIEVEAENAEEALKIAQKMNNGAIMAAIDVSGPEVDVDILADEADEVEAEEEDSDG